jgi:hypothetical protein
MNRMRLLLALALMPDEAFSWFVLAAVPSAMLHGATAQIWPDGIGGFSDESKQAITEVRDAANAYLADARGVVPARPAGAHP